MMRFRTVYLVWIIPIMISMWYAYLNLLRKSQLKRKALTYNVHFATADLLFMMKKVINQSAW